MKSDLYTKAILTVIALCLVWMCLNGLTPPVGAQGNAGAAPPTPVVLVDSRGVPVLTAQGLPVNLGSATVPVLVRNQTVPVQVDNDILPIVLRAIERRGVWQPIQVDVLRPPPTLMPTP
jgi:hypothetical protein